MLPQKIGKYRIKSYLGGGRFGDVYLAEDTIINEEFALKVFRTTPGASISNFLKEIKTLYSLEHPAIVRYFTTEIFEGKLILVTEYIKGITLRKFIEDNAPVNLETVFKLISPICDALDYAHSRGVIHRDVKPENIMVCEDGRVKLMDFGLAKFLEGEMSQSISGTPSYMAPECWSGKYSPSSDQWAVAVIVYELLKGINPFVGNNLDSIREKIKKSSIKWEIFKEIPPFTIDALKKALSKRPYERFESCNSFMKALTHEIVEKNIFVEMSRLPQKISEFTLTEEQLKAVKSEGRKIMLIGGAGTGKTHTLCAKVVYLIKEKGVEPSNIFVSTFTVKAWKEMEAKLHKALKEKVKDLWIGNFHYQCFLILQAYGERLGLKGELKIIPKEYQRKILSDILKEVGLWQYTPKELEELIERGRTFGPKYLQKKEREIYVKILKPYFERLRKEGFVDYTDILILTWKLLMRFSDIREKYRNNFKYILIDEYQDFNRIQMEIVKLLLSGKSCFFVTGDDDQCIYQWRGTNPDFIRRYDFYFPDFTLFYLTKTFRLPPEILIPSLNLIRVNRDRLEKVFWTDKERGKGSFSIHSFLTPKEEASFIAKKIKSLKDYEGRSYNDIAILFRANFRSRIIEEHFSSAGVPYSFLWGRSFYRRDEILGLIHFLNCILNPSMEDSLKALLKFPKPLLKEEDEKKILKKVKKGNLWNALNSLSENKELKRLIELIEELHENSENITPSKALRIGVDAIGLFEFLQSRGDESSFIKMENINEFLEMAKDFEERSKEPTISSFLKYIKSLTESGIMKEEEGVKLLTVHSSKGLEFPVVFLVGMIEGEFPLSRSLTSPEAIEEERRLCYVGITRAIERLYITYSMYRDNFKANPTRPSRFLREMVGM
ncbi:MAG: UvrD-helicase domain-containing protein [Candidatus Aminicenantia bacterium]